MVARAILALYALGMFCVAGAAAANDAEPAFHAEPKIGWKRGDHHLDLAFDFRYRYENWQAFATQRGHC